MRDDAHLPSIVLLVPCCPRVKKQVDYRHPSADLDSTNDCRTRYPLEPVRACSEVVPLGDPVVPAVERRVAEEEIQSWTIDARRNVKVIERRVFERKDIVVDA